MARQSFKVVKSFEAANVGDGDACDSETKANDTLLNIGDVLWAFPEANGFVRFSKGHFAVFCVNADVFLECAVKIIPPQ